MKKYVMALDQGTTSSRCIIFDKKGNEISSAQKEFRQIYPKEGWVEHDPMEIWSTQIGMAQEALLKVGLTHENIDSIGITNQRETVVVWDKKTGGPVYNAIVWQCRRTAEMADSLIEQGHLEMIKKKTGLLIDAYFCATKIKWILDNVEGVRERADKGEILFGTVETWLIWNLTGGKVHITDFSNASRTMLFNIHSLEWDDELLDLLDIPKNILPKAVECSSIYGETISSILGGPIKIGGAAGDQQSALFGQTAFKRGDMKNTYGTGCFLLMNTGKNPVESKNGLLTTIAWGINGEVEYALEGSVFIAGAAIQWLRDEVKLIDESPDTEWYAGRVEDTAGVYLVPAFVGLGAPHWDPYARGCIVGLTRGANKYHIVRAALESLAYQSKDLIDAMEKDSKIKTGSFKVDGGASENNFLMQFQADILNKPVERPKCIETTALGAAYLAGLATGYWKNKEEIVKNWQLEKEFLPDMTDSKRDDLLRGWNRAVECSKGWISE